MDQYIRLSCVDFRRGSVHHLCLYLLTDGLHTLGAIPVPFLRTLVVLDFQWGFHPTIVESAPDRRPPRYLRIYFRYSWDLVA